jgi:hypothetical protein
MIQIPKLNFNQNYMVERTVNIQSPTAVKLTKQENTES